MTQNTSEMVSETQVECSLSFFSKSGLGCFETVLHLAAQSKRESIFCLLMKMEEEACHSPKEQEEFRRWLSLKNKEKLTCMHYCAYNGIIGGLELLLKYKAPLESNQDGMNPVHFAAQGNCIKSLTFFRDNSYPLETLDLQEGTPLHWACYSRNDTAVMFLTAWNVNVNAKDKQGFTPLHLAVTEESSKSVKRLLTKGADRYAKNNENKTPIDYAFEQKNEYICDLLVLSLCGL